MFTFKKVALGLAAVTIMAIPSMGAQVLCGGNVPLVNTMVATAAMSLDFSGAGTDVEIANFIVNNNSQEFEISWTLLHSGSFNSGPNTIPFTALKEVDGGLQAFGTGAAAAIVTNDLGPILPALWVAPILLQSGTQTAATINKKCLLQASWADASANLTGLYTEQITYSVRVTLM